MLPANTESRMNEVYIERNEPSMVYYNVIDRDRQMLSRCIGKPPEKELNLRKLNAVGMGGVS